MREDTVMAREEIPQASLKDTLCAADAELTNAMQLAREICCAVRRPEDKPQDAAEEPRDLLSAGAILAGKARDLNILIAQIRALLVG